MTSTDRTFMGAHPHVSNQTACLGRAIGDALRRMHPHHTAKLVAQDVGCTVKAAENLIDGHLSSTSIARVIAAYGAGWVAERVLEAAGLTLENYIRARAAEARASAHHHEEVALELSRLESALRASADAQRTSVVGRGP
ncbi:MAG: hypothetical protein JNK30_21100 [Phenylobacterium sp.]|uniref:hypothetical protein n=1 Tax=Phenylobacterium sp. TaxID=1871053 RepID=UPI001A375A64|nr:hypothetical protein [Phenylobacterium sp.]MBL8773898.1 hypothetical protein [Phenylobacterium sp.]